MLGEAKLFGLALICFDFSLLQQPASRFHFSHQAISPVF